MTVGNARGFNRAVALLQHQHEIAGVAHHQFLGAQRGIPATVRRGNSLSLELFDQAVTPAFLPFYRAHREAFDAWQRGPAVPAAQPATSPPPSDAPPPLPPERPAIQPTHYRHQPGLFD